MQCLNSTEMNSLALTSSFQKDDTVKSLKVRTTKQLNCTESPSSSPIEPATYDVLCGKDKTYNQHKGNQMFRDQITAFKSQYQTTQSKPEKMDITKQIVNILKEKYNSRFLKWNVDDSIWEEINDLQARDKISHALRFATTGKKKRARKSKQSIQTSKTTSTNTIINNNNNNNIKTTQHFRVVSVYSLTTASRITTEHDELSISNHSTSNAIVAPSAYMVNESTKDFVDNFLFQRQMQILESMANDTIDKATATLNSQSNTEEEQDEDEEEEEEEQERFDTLRSEDLDLIMSEPLDVSEWVEIDHLIL